MEEEEEGLMPLWTVLVAPTMQAFCEHSGTQDMCGRVFDTYYQSHRHTCIPSFLQHLESRNFRKAAKEGSPKSSSFQRLKKSSLSLSVQALNAFIPNNP